MNNNTSKAFCLSAFIALTVVGGGLISPASANWVVSNSFIPALTVGSGRSYVYHDTTGGTAPVPAHQEGNSSVTIKWQGTDPTVDGTTSIVYVTQTTPLNFQQPSVDITTDVTGNATAAASTILHIDGVGSRDAGRNISESLSDGQRSRTDDPALSGVASSSQGKTVTFGTNGPTTQTFTIPFAMKFDNSVGVLQSPAAGTTMRGYVGAQVYDASLGQSTFSITQ